MPWYSWVQPTQILARNSPVVYPHKKFQPLKTSVRVEFFGHSKFLGYQLGYTVVPYPTKFCLVAAQVPTPFAGNCRARGEIILFCGFVHQVTVCAVLHKRSNSSTPCPRFLPEFETRCSNSTDLYYAFPQQCKGGRGDDSLRIAHASPRFCRDCRPIPYRPIRSPLHEV